ncbi:MAG: ATP-binding protein [Acetobacteraceae bacterium]|nr:ATP-binding protein [Acetobacteraceae bacterium]
MLKRMTVRNLTVFPEVDCQFGRNLNVVVGENGTGKTHLLKMAYSVLAASWEESRKPNAAAPTKALLQSRLAEKLINVFRPEHLGRLVSRQRGRARCDIAVECEPEEANVSFSFGTISKREVAIEKLPERWIEVSPAWFPTRELLTIYPNFASIYESRYLEYEETWRDTCRLLGEPLRRGPRDHIADTLLVPLEDAMDGKLVLENNGRFYLNGSKGNIEISLVAEGLRKFGMLARLISNGTLLNNCYLFWDEPEANLNPRLVAKLADAIVGLSVVGVQVFIATHSLFLLREFEMLLGSRNHEAYDARFFGLHAEKDGVRIDQGSSIDDVGDIGSLDEELAQSDRYMNSEI